MMSRKTVMMMLLIISTSFFAMGCFSSGDKSGGGFTQSGTQPDVIANTTIAGYLTDFGAAAPKQLSPQTAAAPVQAVLKAAAATGRRVTIVADKKEYILTTDTTGFFKADIELPSSKTLIFKVQKSDGSYTASELFIEKDKIYYLSAVLEDAGMQLTRETIGVFQKVMQTAPLKIMIGVALAEKQKNAQYLSKISGRFVTSQLPQVPASISTQSGVVNTTEEPSSPIGGAAVTLNGSISAVTDDNGYFSFAGQFAAGSYIISARKSGYSVKNLNITVSEKDYGLESLDFILQTNSVFNSLILDKTSDIIVAGDSYDLSKIKVYANYLDGITAEVKVSWTADRGSIFGTSYISTISEKGTVMLTASYTEAKTTKTALFTLSVNMKLDSLYLSKSGDTMEVLNKYDLASIKTIAVYSDLSTAEVKTAAWSAVTGSISGLFYTPPDNFLGILNIDAEYKESGISKKTVFKLTMVPKGGGTPTAMGISSVEPPAGTFGTQIKLNGNNFGDSQGNNILKLNGITIADQDIVAWSQNIIIFNVPFGTSSGYITISTGSSSMTAIFFDVIGVTSINPTIIAAGERLIINGTGFGNTPSSSAINMGNLVATKILKWENTKIEILCPDQIKSASLSINLNGLQTNPVQYDVSEIVSVVPAFGPPGTAVTLYGSGFGISQENSTVTFNGAIAADIVSWANDAITVNVPADGTSGNLSFNFNGIKSANHLYFDVTKIDSISPNFGPSGTGIEITGTGFGAERGLNAVSFNGIKATEISDWSNKSITAKAPALVVSSTVSVVINNINSNGINFNASSVSSILPTSGTVGTSVTVNGTGFGTEKGSNFISFNDIVSTDVTLWSSNKIVATVPAGANSGKIKLSIGGVSMDGPTFTVGAVITSLSETFMTIGSPVTISGINFGAAPGTSSVKFNGTQALPADIVSWSNEAVICRVPAGTTPGKVVVTVNGIESNGATFGILNITSVSPAGGTVGTTVTVTGIGLGALQGQSAILFGQTPATEIISWSDTQAVLKVPAGAGTGSVQASVGGKTSNSMNFTFIFINTVSVNYGPPGTIVEIDGSGFGPYPVPNTIKFNATTATNILSWSDTHIKAEVPAGTTSGNITVNTAAGISNGVYYEATFIDSATPVIRSTGNQIVINGRGFGPAPGTSLIKFNGTTASNIVSWSDAKIVVAVPAGATSGSLYAIVNGINTNTIVDFKLISINSLSSTAGTIGSPITIFGTGFGNSQSTSEVKFGSLAAIIDFWSDSQIIARVPADAVSGNVTANIDSYLTNSIYFSVTSLSSLSPSYGPQGTFVTLNGSNFGSAPGTNFVKFNGLTAVANAWSDTQIVAQVPSGATAGNVTVNVNGVDTNSKSFSVTNITSITPGYGPEKMSVTIGGIGFGPAQGTSILKFNGLTATTIDSWSDSTITATIPDGASSGNVTVSVWGAVSAGYNFSVTKLTSLVPAQGPPGTLVSLNGTGFGELQGNSLVKFNDVVATDITSWSDTVITAKVPIGAASGNVVVTINGMSTAGLNFDATNIANITPAFAVRHALISITGSGFGTLQGASSVKLNGTAIAISSWSNTLIKAFLPADATPGYIAVTVNALPSNSKWFEVILDYSVAASVGTIGNGGNNMNNPSDVAVDSLRNIYVADKSNNRVQKINAAGVFSGWIGRGDDNNSGFHSTASTAIPMSGKGSSQFNAPGGVAVDTLDNLYVADTGNSCVQKFNSAGTYIYSIGSAGSGDGQFVSPVGIAVDLNGNIYVTDTNLHRVTVFSAGGNYTSKFGSFGSGDGQFASPGAIAVSSAGYIYVADSFNHRIQKFNSTGVYQSKWGSFGSDNSEFMAPAGIAVDGAGNVYVADTNNARIQKFDPNGNLIKNFDVMLGPANHLPLGIDVDSSRYIYTADGANNQAQKFQPQP